MKQHDAWKNFESNAFLPVIRSDLRDLSLTAFKKKKKEHEKSQITHTSKVSASKCYVIYIYNYSSAIYIDSLELILRIFWLARSSHDSGGRREDLKITESLP